MKIRYSDSIGEIEVGGSVADMHQIVTLLHARSGGSLRAADTGSPAPYTDFLKCLSVEPRPGHRLDVQVTGQRELHISGDPRHLQTLARNVQSLADMCLGDHWHLDHYPDHPYLAESSKPVVFSLE